MSVYVDNALNDFGRMKMSHMIADSLEELHQMADAIGVQRRWYQPTNHPHYDICQSKRKLAIKMGAIPMSTRDVLIKINFIRKVASSYTPPARAESEDKHE